MLNVHPPAWEAPLLALLTPNAPPTAIALVGCLQQGPGSALLQERYLPQGRVEKHTPTVASRFGERVSDQRIQRGKR